ncbi:MAG: ABC transporter permease [Chloroflexi bacterium]|nr:ABC transporter permease [Chloroflexota bacterium]MDA1219605.1 ABC transporter permease [Chloroflexota bacterium]
MNPGNSSAMGSSGATLEYRPTKASFLTWLIRSVRRKPLGAFGGVLVVFMLSISLFAGVLQNFDPIEPHYADRLVNSNSTYWMGTDQFGRDLYSRLLHGTRVSMLIGFSAITIASVGGGLIGIIVGYRGGVLDLIVQRVVDILMAFPTIIMAMVVVTALGTSLFTFIFAIALVQSPNISRITRAVTLSIRERGYIDAARAVGVSEPRLILRHILPNTVSPWIVMATAELGTAILTESTLSFLGIGIQEPNASLGTMLTGVAQQYRNEAPWMVIWPGVAISIAVFGLNIFGDAIRDLLDPRQRGR